MVVLEERVIVLISKRIRDLRKQKNLTQSELAARLGLTQQAVGKWERGQSVPDYHMLVKIAAALEVKPENLFAATQSQSVQGNTELNRGEDLVRIWMHDRDVRPYLPETEVMLPVLGEVRAGYGLHAQETDLGTMTATVREPSRYFYLLIRGDSMEPRIRDGDLALVRIQPMLEDGDLGVVVYGDGEGTIKRFYHKGGTVALQAFNPAYETLILSGEELEKLFIIGKVIETKTIW